MSYRTCLTKESDVEITSPSVIVEADSSKGSLFVGRAGTIGYYNKVVKAESRNIQGGVISYITCNIDWSGDLMKIYSLYPKTTAYLDNLVHGDGGYRKSREFIKTDLGVDYGYVQKGLAIFQRLFPTDGNAQGVLTIDVKVGPTGFVNKSYGAYLPMFTFNNYVWVNP